ncbi:MAG: class I SAM-dependent methyltransferase [Candidatus Pacearchaeota archaeon]|jgi:SAM-dependent methyltransferase
MKNKNFFYLQYNKINWQNQEKTKINNFVNNFIIKEIISKHHSQNIHIFDIGFGIGFFLKMLYQNLNKSFKDITLAGCEPSDKNYNYFVKKKPLISGKNVKLKIYNKTFQDMQIDDKFDFITAIYVFPHFSPEDLEKITQKIYSMLDEKGKFILVVANEKYLEEKLKDKRDLCIENNTIKIDSKEYKEVLHYSDIPQIGKLIDYNREEQYYLDLFNKKGFELIQKKDLDDNGFICTVFVFQKK